MGTTFEELYTEWMLPVINDYKLDKMYISNKDVVFEFLRTFLKNGLSDFDSITPLTYHSEEIIDSQGNTKTIYLFDNELDDDEKKIVSKIAVSNYFKRLIQDVRSRMPYFQQRDFKKESLAPLMKENDSWYNNLVSEYMADIENYHLKHLDKLEFWEDYY